MAVSYIINWMLAEFAAAAVVFAKGAYDYWDGGDGDEDDEEQENSIEEDGDKCTFPMFSGSIEGIIQESYTSIR